MQTMTRAEAADKLIDRYAGYFDISPGGHLRFPRPFRKICAQPKGKALGGRQPRICVPVFCAPSDGGYLQLLPGLCLGAWHG